MESVSLASNSLGSPAVALHETIFIYIFIASLIMAKFPSSFLQLFKGFSQLPILSHRCPFAKWFQLLVSCRAAGKDRNSSAFFTPGSEAGERGGQRVVKDKKLHLFEFNWKTQTQNAIFAKAKRNGKQGEAAEGTEGRKPINRSKLQLPEGGGGWGVAREWGKQNIVKQSWRKTSRAKLLARPQKSDKDDGKNQQTGNNRKSTTSPPSLSALPALARG